MSYDWAPFALGLLLFVGSDIPDRLWVKNYLDFYANLSESADYGHETQLQGAKWAVDVAQATPSALLTVVGAVILLPDVNPVLPALLIVLVFVGFLLMVTSVKDDAALHSFDNDLKGPSWVRRSRLQVTLAVISVIGLGLSIYVIGNKRESPTTSNFPCKAVEHGTAFECSGSAPG